MALFLTHQSPHRQASTSTISRWIVEAFRAGPLSFSGPSASLAPMTQRGSRLMGPFFGAFLLMRFFRMRSGRILFHSFVAILPMSYGTKVGLVILLCRVFFLPLPSSVVHVRSAATIQSYLPSLRPPFGGTSCNYLVFYKVTCPRGKLVVLSRV